MASSGVLGGGSEPSLTTVEQRGIEYVPPGERWGGPSSLFWMWAGAVWNIEFVVYGALAMVVFGLSFAQAVIVILIGNLFYFLTGLASLQGPAAGTTTFGISRAAFGPNGNRLPSFFNWITQVGFEIEGIALIVFAAILLTSKAGFTAGVAAKIIFIVLAVLIQAVLPLLGHAAVLRVLRWLAIPFVVLFAVMAGLTTPKVNLDVPRARRQLGRADHRPGAGDLGRRPRLDRERQRLLPVPASGHRQEADRARRRTRRRDPLGSAGGSRCRHRDRGADRHHPQRAGGRVPRLVRLAVPDLRHRAAVRDQHARPVLIRA